MLQGSTQFQLNKIWIQRSIVFNHTWIQLLHGLKKYLDSTQLTYNKTWIQQNLNNKNLDSINLGFNDPDFNNPWFLTILNSTTLGFKVLSPNNHIVQLQTVGVQDNWDLLAICNKYNVSVPYPKRRPLEINDTVSGQFFHPFKPQPSLYLLSTSGMLHLTEWLLE